MFDDVNENVIKRKLDGEKEVDENTRKTRYDICKECDQLDKKWLTCNQCGCWMPVKARLPFFKCKINKW